MCGIVGLVDLKGHRISEEILENMTNTLKHRGPDDQGFWISENVGLGHRRLAIIDLSQNAAQPMVSRDERFVLSYNGEIYNYLEIRAELEEIGFKFQSTSDTEVILNSLIAWRDKALEKFNGMFALAFYDSRDRELLLARDRFGIKPLYYSLSDGYLSFASEQKAIQARLGYTKRLDLEALVEYFTFQNILTNKTLDADIQILPPGHYLKVDLKSATTACVTKQYWDWNFVQPSEIKTLDEYTEEFHFLMSQAVKRAMVGDVEVGSYLSGGIDSGYVAALASRVRPNLKTFAIGFDMTEATDDELLYDETEKANMISKSLGTSHYVKKLMADDMEKSLEKLTWHIEEPRIGQSYPNMFAAKLASEHVKVVLSGAGGDELFGGYPWRYFHGTKNMSFERFTEEYYRYWQRLVSNQDLTQMFAPISSKISHIWTYDIFKSVFNRNMNSLETPEDFLNHSLYFETKTFLHGLFIIEDKLSMAYGLETRVPFMDNDLVDFAMNLPASMKIRNLSSKFRINENTYQGKKDEFFAKTHDGKLIVRESMKRFLNRDSTLEVKQGFSAPDSSWFRGQSSRMLEISLLNRRNPMYNILDFYTVKRLVHEHTSGTRNRRLLIWSLLNFNELVKYFG